MKEHYYFNEDWQELEVRKETSGTISAYPLEQFIWHPYYTDALVTRFHDADADGMTVVQHYFTHDANYNVTAAVNDSGAVVERYDYSPYGELIIYDDDFDFDDDDTSDIAASRLYTGQRLDSTVGLYQYRNRWYHPSLGRFVTRDPIGYEGSEDNLYEYAESAPLINTDSTGEIIETAADVVCACSDLYNLCTDPSWSNAGWFCWSAGACVVPCVPGSYSGKAIKYCKKKISKAPDPPKKPPKKPKPEKSCHCSCPLMGSPPAHCPKFYKYSYVGTCTAAHKKAAFKRANAEAGAAGCNNPAKGYRIKHCGCFTVGG